MRLVFVLLSIFQTASAFAPVQTVSHLKTYSNYPYEESQSSVNLSAVNPLSPELQSTLMIAEVEEWRQYVPLIVSFGVILDILLGSPIANLALGPMRRAAGASSALDDEEGGVGGFQKNPKERVDSDGLAQAAIEKARYSMELRKFLDENKTDEQRYEEMRKKIDQQASQLEGNLDKLFDDKK
ncbi:hypothetical protein CTEN210_15474 [Chaetoceros tenuissimus]|uniref:Uncharacterized protein n=1 Tax=Chaetoceros tenuissimus TaxID=426638 RepID=A0AAD3HDG4_9STRA|nr:hypothetical protein CTEN210_15474 [Chaetoceros tenuissimus]